MSHYDSQPETEENSAQFYHNRTQPFPGQEDKKKKKKKTIKKKIDNVGDNKSIKSVPQDITATNSCLQKTVLKTKKKEIKKEQENSNQETKKQGKEQKKKEITKIRRFQTQDQIPQINYKRIQEEQTQPVVVKRKVSSSPKKQRSGKKDSKFQENYRVCEHVGIFNKLLISFVLTAVYIVFLRPLPKISYPLAQYGQQIHQRVFQIVTDRKTVTLRFPIQITQPIFQILPITSTKSARIKASLNCSLGYKFESISTTPSTQHIQMSDLQILSCTINEVQLFNKEDGLFNPWEFRDHQKLLSFINQHYVTDLKKQALSSISQEKKEMYATRAEILFRGIHEKYQGWLDWLIGRISTYVDFGLEPYVKKVQLMYAKDRVNKQEVDVQGD